MTFRPGRFEANLDRLEAAMMRDPVRRAFAAMSESERTQWQRWQAQLTLWHADKQGSLAYQMSLEGHEPPPPPKAVAKAFGFDKHHIAGNCSIERAAEN
jgi:hypothetical protein